MSYLSLSFPLSHIFHSRRVFPPVVSSMENPSANRLLTYARHHKLAEDCTAKSTLTLVDETCEPQPLLPPRDDLKIPNPEERMKKVYHDFYMSVLEQPLRAKAEDITSLREAMHPKPSSGNVWRGVLPPLKTSDLAPAPFLNTFNEDEGIPLSTGFVPWRSVSQVGSPGDDDDDEEEEVEEQQEYEPEGDELEEGEEDEEEDEDLIPGTVLPPNSMPNPIIPQAMMQSFVDSHGQAIPTELILNPVLTQIDSVRPTDAPSGQRVTLTPTMPAIPEMIDLRALIAEHNNWRARMEASDEALQRSIEHLEAMTGEAPGSLGLANVYNNPDSGGLYTPPPMNAQVCAVSLVSEVKCAYSNRMYLKVRWAIPSI